MIDLSTRYLGLELRSPLVASPSPLCHDLGNIRKMEDYGAGAVVLHSLFEEQITLELNDLDRHLTHGSESFGEALTYFPDIENYGLGPDAYLEHLAAAKEAVEIPVIASINGVSKGGWVTYASRMEEAGADALELNVYYVATDAAMDGAAVEHMYIDLLREVRAAVNIPIAIKIAPYFSSMAHMAQQLDAAGANALVLFNRFYQPDFDLEALRVTPNLVLSSPNELRLRLRWAAILYGRIQADIAITGGVHSGVDALKAMMAGANVAMMTSALLKHGVEYLAHVRQEMLDWMEDHEYDSVALMRGSMSQKNVAEPAAFERANYMKVLGSYTGRV